MKKYYLIIHVKKMKNKLVLSVKNVGRMTVGVWSLHVAPHVWPCVLALQGNRNGFLQMLQLIYFKFIFGLLCCVSLFVPTLDT